MTLAALLAAYSAGTAAVAPRLLARAGWTYRAPRLGVLTWFTLATTTLLAALLGCATLVIPAVGAGLAHLLHTTLLQVRRDYGDSGGPTGIVVGAVAGSLLLLRLGYCGVRAALDTRRVRLRHRASLALLDAEPQDRPDPAGALLVLPHPTPAAYCVPGRPPRVVITSATRDLLDPDQLAGVLAHERAHLRGRHALLLGCAGALRRAFGALPVFTTARREIGQLLEMRADDAATAVCDRVRLAEALVLLAEAGHRAGSAPDGLLAVAGSDALARVRRLAGPHRPLATGYQALTLIALLVCALLPVAASVAPAVVAADTSHPAAVVHTQR